MTRLLHRFLLPTLLVCALTPAAYATNGGMLTTIGSRGPVAFPMEGDAQTFFRMPSGIAWSLDHRIDLTLFGFQQKSTMDNTLNSFESTDFAPGASGGFLIAPLRSTAPEGSAVGKFTYAFGLFPDLGGGTEAGGATVRWQNFPNGFDVGTGALFLSATGSTAYAFSDWLSVGFGLNLLLVTVNSRTLFASSGGGLAGTPQVSGVNLPGNPTYGDLLDLFSTSEGSDPTTVVEAELSGVQFAPILSFSLRPMKNLAFGFSVRPRSFVLQELTGTADTDAGVTFGTTLSSLGSPLDQLFLGTLPRGGARGFRSTYDARVTQLHSPAQVRLNVAWRPIPRLMLAGEVAWIEWHKAIGTVEVELTNGSSEDVNFVIGSSAVDATLAQRWSNQWVFSLFAEFAVHERFLLRTGFNYGRTPLNTRRIDNAPTSALVETHLYLGCGIHLGRFEINLLGEVALPKKVRGGEAAQSATGRNSRYESFQSVVTLGIGVKF